MLHTPIKNIGMAGLLDRIKNLVDSEFISEEINNNLLKGISDDSAVFKNFPDRIQFLTSDSFVEGVHFDLTFTSMTHLGWKGVVASISDIIAMGGTAVYLIISFCIPQKISIEMIEEFYKGALQACKKYRCKIVGGNSVATAGNFVINITAYGIGKAEKVFYRNGAKINDLICVTGHLGASFAGLKILQREKKNFIKEKENFKPNLEPYKSALEKYLMPKPRVDIVNLIIDNIQINSMIDISDGLAADVHKICKESNVGVELWEHNIPIANITKRIAEEFSENVIDYALYGGEEYELLFTLSDSEYEVLENLTSDVTILGRIVENSKGINFIREDGESEPLQDGIVIKGDFEKDK